MKKVIFVQLFALICNVCLAQELITVQENFDQNKFNWDELFSENGSIVLVNEMLMIENKSDTQPINAICNLPIAFDEDFTASVVFNKPKINDKNFLGIVFNYEDEDNYWLFLVKEKEAWIGRFHEGKFRRVRTNPIILKKGDKNDVLLQLERSGRNITFSVDNMEVKKHQANVINNTFGIILFGKGKLNVSSVEVKHYDRNN